MIGTEQFTIPRYLKIAVDISARIASGDIQQGEKLKGRSVLSTEYNVSPETIRRAMSILSDKKVVEIALGSGIVVSSKENAIQFLKNFKDDESVAELRMKLSQMLDRRRSMDEEISSLTKQIIDLYKYKRSDLITPVEIPLPSSSPVIGKSIGALEVWHNTGATIIGVIQEKSIIISPGPYYEFVQSDKILIVGDENVIERFNAFINGIN
ncbi:TrkA C-terminal domain-containing protein [Ruminiclostridium cellobioparum]|jgi:K+/H+ antiporter YhaU regulatory subunit KhtT|uniref:GntR family transcriptional regulator n=1 Tax=Ruminiclostridium cellobioparum subsp. termitidis CT1112 TaxID=1195236 RepID=S0FJP3_RUMCE|nr:TrkA C-terminal domain-containing protein [Ruminiclostridium cellobioparum]EMS69324.1 GntR family transcriptional regulator [Ruminiclostridium cellobioparum subsp. termitidis CT1112]